MASRTTTVVTDDIDGSEGASSHTFAIDKQTYSIDLSDANFAKLQAALQPFIEKSPTKSNRPRQASSTSGTSSDYDREAFKTWAVENDIKLGRGRPPRSLIDSFLNGSAPAAAKKRGRKADRG